MPPEPAVMTPDVTMPSNGPVRLIKGDALYQLGQLQEQGHSFDMACFSPPYFGQLDYGLDGQYGIEESMVQYLDNLVLVFTKISQLLVDGSVCWVIIGDTSNVPSPIRSGNWRNSDGWDYRRKIQSCYREKAILPIAYLLSEMVSQSTDLFLRQSLVWSKSGAGGGRVNKSDAPRLTHEHILMFGKASGYRPYLNTNPLPSSVLEFAPENHPGHLCPFPVGLVKTLLKTWKGDTCKVLDPFIGSGSTAIACMQLGYECVGIDLDVSVATQRILENI